MDYTTTIKYPIKYYEMLRNKALKESSLLLMLQDVATQNADRLGFGGDFMFSNNYAWFLLKYKIVMKKWPKDEQEIIIKTVPRGFYKFYAYREGTERRKPFKDSLPYPIPRCRFTLVCDRYKPTFNSGSWFSEISKMF